MGTFTTATTEEADGTFTVVINSPDGTELYRSTEDDEAAATRVANKWKGANLATCCINGDRATVNEALDNWGLPAGRFEVVERPDASCVVKGPAKAIEGLLKLRRAYACPPLTPDP